MKSIRILFLLILVAILSVGCREESVVYLSDPDPVDDPSPIFEEIQGFYLLNEGNMGSNKSTLDRYVYADGIYTRNIYSEVNPDVPKELGDVGNDLKIYGSRLYAVINCSNKIEVMDAATARRIGQIDIPNCRYIEFDGAYAYVTSYAGPVEIRPDYSQKGYVAKVDTATLQVVDRCIVGFQPDELAILGGKIYVANSGGYMVPNYENTVSVIDLERFVEERRIEIAINLHRIRPDSKGRLWITSRGDYYDKDARLFCFNPKTDQIEKTFDVPVSQMDISGDSIYVVSASWSYETMSNTITNAIIDTRMMEKVSDNFIKDGTENQIKIPYGVKINPLTGQIFVTDAGNYVNPGWLYCFSREGLLQWKVRTGDIPAHFAFFGK